jgi:uncharacterized protein (TIGR03437 family)
MAWAALALGLPIAALADLSATKTLTATQSLNLDTGATASSGGDLLWNGSSLTPQGTAKALNVPGGGGSAVFDSLTQSTIQSFSSLASAASIPSSGLPVGAVVIAFTNGGHAAKVLVTAASSSSITLQFTTYGATGGGGGGGPTITNVTNNSSDIPSGFPNSGLTQGALIKILGSSLADDGDANLHDSQAAGGLPTTLNGAKVTVTVGATTVTLALYYATPTQIDGVLPSNTPTGSGTLTVTHNGTPSAAFTILVVTAAPGITTYNNGTVVAQDFARPSDPYGGLVTFQKSAPPDGIITIWGSGFGATGNSDTSYDVSGHQTSVSYAVYIGGVSAAIAYKGAAPYPGVSIFVLTIPHDVPTGCYVPVAAVATVNGNSIVSNIGTLPIKAGGGVCSDPQFGINGDQLSALGASVKSGFLFVSQSTDTSAVVSNNALAVFQQSTGVATPGGGSVVSIGGCILTQTINGGSTGTSTGLNAGTITVTGPGGSPVTLTGIPLLPGFYQATLSSIPSTGGAYVFNGTAGSQVGAFTGTVNFPNPLLAWTNQGAAANVARSQGLLTTWTGGAPGSYVLISGTSASGSVTGGFTCYAPQSALQFTVPSYILLGLPHGTGTTSVQNSTNLTTFSAAGLDFGAAFGNVSIQVNSNYN